LYIGTDAGVFFTQNLGSEWVVLGTGLPNSPVFDLNYHQPSQRLVAGTHGRSLFEFDLSGISGIGEEADFVISDFVLYQNYPNPFNPATKISWQTSTGAHQTIRIYDAIGNEILTLIDEYVPAGNHEVTFDATGLSTGIYFYRLKAGDKTQSKKMILLK